jgi:hypothetical protein
MQNDSRPPPETIRPPPPKPLGTPSHTHTCPTVTLCGGCSFSANVPYSPRTQHMQHSSRSGSTTLLPLLPPAASADPTAPAAVPLSSTSRNNCKHSTAQHTRVYHSEVCRSWIVTSLDPSAAAAAGCLKTAETIPQPPGNARRKQTCAMRILLDYAHCSRSHAYKTAV